MRIVAMYLPQFHTTVENDRWWGKGFTEWSTVKAARPLFEGHDQPKIPKGRYYYDLLSKETILRQNKLMRQYGIDGICMYHYWFKDGKRVLERPEQNLLAWQDVDMPFCFCWANETWARSWSNVKVKNSWALSFEDVTEEDNKDDGILMLQDYGNSQQWKEHFFYLLPYFRDRRYIRIDEKPVFVIYMTSLMPCISEMLELWRNLAEENGLKGLYIIGGNCTRDMGSELDGELYHEPQRAMRVIKQMSPTSWAPVRLSASEVWKQLLREKKDYSMQPYYEGFINYDDTPRRGLEGTVITDNSPDLFRINLSRLLKKNETMGSDITFLNAWNEWGEGMYMEPDEKNGYGFLEAIYSARESYQEIKYESNSDISNTEYQKAEVLRKRIDKNLHVLDQWLYLVEAGVSVTEHIRRKYGYGILSIYGYGILGKHLCRELISDGRDISYIVERNADSVHVSTKVYRPDDAIPNCDLMIVTAPYYFEEIRQKMQRRVGSNIISIEDLINEIAEENGL